MMSAAATIIAAARNTNAASGDTALHSSPATAEAIRFPAWTVASSPNADPRNCPGASAATAALCAVSPQPIPSPASTNAGSSSTG